MKLSEHSLVDWIKAALERRTPSGGNIRHLYVRTVPLSPRNCLLVLNPDSYTYAGTAPRVLDGVLFQQPPSVVIYHIPKCVEEGVDVFVYVLEGQAGYSELRARFPEQGIQLNE